MPRFSRRPISIREPRAPVAVAKSHGTSGEEVADFTIAILRTQLDAYPDIKGAVQAVVKDNGAPNVVNLITQIVKAQLGEDEAHSPMLVSLVDDLGVDADEVELAQDSILAGLDVAHVISQAVSSGNPRAALWQIMGLVGQLIPELEADIEALKS